METPRKKPIKRQTKKPRNHQSAVKEGDQSIDWRHKPKKSRKNKKQLPGERAADLAEVDGAEEAPQAVECGVLGPEGGRVTEEEAEVRELLMEAGEGGVEGAAVAGEVLVAMTLIVVQLADVTELELPFASPLHFFLFRWR